MSMVKNSLKKRRQDSLDEEPALALEKLSKSLAVVKSIISISLHRIGKIQREEKWLSHMLKGL